MIEEKNIQDEESRESEVSVQGEREPEVSLQEHWDTEMQAKEDPENGEENREGRESEAGTDESARTRDSASEVLELLDERIRRALEDMGFEKLTPIQEQAIPALLQGQDIIGQAQTGTGKTAAFGIPLIQRVDPEQQSLQAIVLCPTRELAIQAALELRKLAKYIQGLRSCRSMVVRISAARSGRFPAYRSLWEPPGVSWIICAGIQ